MADQENFDGIGFANKARGFDAPTQLPADEQQTRDWQAANRAWWENTPMRYDWRDAVDAAPGTREYFQEIDRRFFESSRHYLPWRSKPFDDLIDYPSLTDKDVLEIGVGHGSHAGLIAPASRSFSGIDLTDTASRMTRERLELMQVEADVRQMDAERLEFADASFDFVWSWGVIHHSADTSAIVRQVARVLRPGGSFTAMVYHRSAWKYLVFDGFFKGVLRAELLRKGSLHRVSQEGTDGAIARHYTQREWRALCAPILPVESIRVLGQKADLLPLPPGLVKDAASRLLPDIVARLLTNTFRFGSFLVATMRKPAQAAASGGPGGDCEARPE